MKVIRRSGIGACAIVGAKFASSDAVAGLLLEAGPMRREDEVRVSGVVFLNNSQLRKSHRRVHRLRGVRFDDAGEGR